MSNNLIFYTGYSLIDITNTGVTRSNDPDSLERNQQRNWETVLQCISLRTQPMQIQPPQEMVVDLSYLNFGDMYQGEQKVWQWIWAVERQEIYDLPNKPLGALMSDFEQVPVVTCLTETARFMLPIFYPYGSIKNIYFKEVSLS
jgi:hypothetical protein